MKIFLAFILLLALANCQVGDLTHFTGGSFFRAGWRPASNGWGRWSNGQWAAFPQPTLNSGGVIYDIAAAGDGFLAVGDFSSIDGHPASSIAYFDGTRWCPLQHLNLYTYTKPNSQSETFPRPSAASAGRGRAVAIDNIGNDYYIFSPSVGFNQVGPNARVGVAGLAKLVFANGNFTLDNSLNYITAGIGETTTNGFPAITNAPASSFGGNDFTKLRVGNSGGVISFYVYTTTDRTIKRWRVNDGRWLTLSQTNSPTFNVSSAPVNFAVTATGISVDDFDLDRTTGTLYVCGTFNNTGDTNTNRRYLNVARMNNAHGTTVEFNIAVNWANNNNFFNAPTRKIAVQDQNTFYVQTVFTSTTTGDNRSQYFVYRVASSTPTLLGGRFANSTGGDPIFQSLVYANGAIHAFGNFELYNQEFEIPNTWRRRYLQRLSGAVRFDTSSNNWVDAFGGYTDVQSRPLVAVTSSSAYVFNTGATRYFNVLSAGGLVAYNRNTKAWQNLAPQRFIIANGDSGNNGGIAGVHFLKNAPSGRSNSVVAFGQFDWYGSSYLGSIAYLSTDGAYEQLGGGVYNYVTGPSFTGDQVQPILTGGQVLGFEEEGDNFYIGGNFGVNSNRVCLNNVAVMPRTGGTWGPLGAGCQGTVYDILSDGSDRIYFGGDFDSCSGVLGTRMIARWNANQARWYPLSTGIPTGGRVYSMVKWGKDLYVGGTFSNSAGSVRSVSNGLWRWDGEEWEGVYSRCEQDCGVSLLSQPWVTTDPAGRGVANVRSMVQIGRSLYLQAGPQSSMSQFLIRYSAGRFTQLGSASGSSGCIKQGCISSNHTMGGVIGVGFSRPGGPSDYDSQYQAYNFDYENWVETFNGFDAAPTFIASSSLLSVSFCLFIVTFVLYLF